MKRATRGFDAKRNCSARTYEYLTPTYAFAKDYVSLFHCSLGVWMAYLCFFWRTNLHSACVIYKNKKRNK